MAPTMSAGLLQYVQDPLNPSQYIPENDPKFSVVTAWMSAQRADTIMRNNAMSVFNQGMKNWQAQAQQADAYGHARPPLPSIPNVEVDQVVAAPDGSYVIQTAFQPVASYPNPLLPIVPTLASVDFGPNSAARQPTAPSPDVAALTARVDALLAMLSALLQQKAA